MTTALRFKLRELLAPKVAIKEKSPYFEEKAVSEECHDISSIVEAEVVLGTEHIRSFLCLIQKSALWSEAIHYMLDDFQSLLMDALDLQREIGSANEQNDRSFWDLPSISPHPQNRGYREWVTLIELLRDAWLLINSTHPDQAKRIAEDWFQRSYPVFKRLALFAAAHSETIDSDEWVAWLLENDACCLWSPLTKRECLRLLVTKGEHLLPPALQTLEEGIVSGPPPQTYNNYEPNHKQLYVDRCIWLRLAQLDVSGCALGDKAREKLEELSEEQSWKLATNESDEFSHWMSGSGDPDFEIHVEQEILPRSREGLVNWFGASARKRSPFYENDWEDICRNNKATVLQAFGALARGGFWPEQEWQDALYVWSDESFFQQPFFLNITVKLLLSMPENEFINISGALSSWVEATSKIKRTEEHKLSYLSLCQRITNIDFEQTDDYSIFQAINHPVGRVTQALLNQIYIHEPSDNDGIPEKSKALLTRLSSLKFAFEAALPQALGCGKENIRFQSSIYLCQDNTQTYRLGRVLMATQLISLFRVAPEWTDTNLLAKMSWDTSVDEASALWSAFFSSSRIYPPLLQSFKKDFLKTAKYFNRLGEMKEQYASFLTYVALETVDIFQTEEIKESIESLPQEGLDQSSKTLADILQGAGDQKEQYWNNRILPFWRNIWPKNNKLISPKIADELAQLCIAADSKFPSAVAEVIEWFVPIEHPYYVLHLLNSSQIPQKYPEDTLTLLSRIISVSIHTDKELSTCLNTIQAHWPDAQYDQQYKRLRELN